MKSWIEQYKPQSIGSMVLPEKIKLTLMNMKLEQRTNNLLFYGKPGSGKSTAARLLENRDSMFINCTSCTMKDFENMSRFCSTMPLLDNHKVVILDEGDCLKSDLQSKLRSVMDRHRTNVQFIMTTNDRSRLLPALVSRFYSMDFDFPLGKSATDQLHKIVKECTSDDEDTCYDRAITNLALKELYPDIRQILTRLEIELRVI